MAEAAARGLAAEPFRLHISSEVLDDLGQSPVTSRSHFPALDASDALAGDPSRFFRPLRRRPLAHQMSVRTPACGECGYGCSRWRARPARSH
jgi:hypothetical protein